MITRYKSVPDLLFRRAAARLTGRPMGRVGVIGGADGPTAFFVARRMKPRYNPGRLSVAASFDPHAARAAARTSFALALFVAALSAALYYFFGRKR